MDHPMTKERREELDRGAAYRLRIGDTGHSDEELREALASDAMRAEQVQKLHRYLLDEHGTECGNEECEIPALLRETAE